MLFRNLYITLRLSYEILNMLKTLNITSYVLSGPKVIVGIRHYSTEKDVACTNPSVGCAIEQGPSIEVGLPSNFSQAPDLISSNIKKQFQEEEE